LHSLCSSPLFSFPSPSFLPSSLFVAKYSFLLPLLYLLLYPLSDGLMAFADSLPITISWGEIIPLSFLPKSCKPVIMSVPTRRLADSVKMIPELLDLGILTLSALLFPYFLCGPSPVPSLLL
jgi:hypothetical protein